MIQGRLRHSLTLRVFGAVVLAAIAPLLLVFAWSQVERGVPGRMWGDTRDAALEASTQLRRSREPPRDTLSQIAHAHKLRVRVFDERGAMLAEIDADDPTDPLHPVEAFFFGARSGPTVRELDEPRGPIALRPEVEWAGAHDEYVACAREDVLVCRGVRRLRDAQGRDLIVYVDKTSARAVQEVYFMRARLVRLAIVTLPLSLLIGLWAAWRVGAPIDRLRKKALEKAQSESPGADLPEHAGEVGELAAAVNALLIALDRRRRGTEDSVADLVHELKSPVAAVRAAAEALTARAPDEDRVKRIGRALEQSSMKLDAVVTQFLDLARVEAGMDSEAREDVDVTELATRVLSESDSDPRFGDVTFATEVPRGPAVVRGVSARLEAALRELVHNAASFAASGGRVAVEVTADDLRVRVKVSDTGPGIASRDIPRVFDRFFTTRGDRRGTGLGLALVRAVAEAHGGRVSVESPEGVGAVFTVDLPRSRAV